MRRWYRCGTESAIRPGSIGGPTDLLRQESWMTIWLMMLSKLTRCSAKPSGMPLNVKVVTHSPVSTNACSCCTSTVFDPVEVR